MEIILAQWDTQLRVIAGIAIAMILGGLIGIEREFADKPAGFRTHTLVPPPCWWGFRMYSWNASVSKHMGLS